MSDDHEPAWVKADRARSVATSQRIRAQTSTLDNDTLFWIDFDSSGERAFNRILCRKVGDANSYEVQLSWQSMTDSALADLRWRAVAQPYPPSRCNHTMRLVEIEPDRQAALAMLSHHEQWAALRAMCQDMHNSALLSRARQDAGVYAGERY